MNTGVFGLNGDDRINLQQVSFLLIDSNKSALDILNGIVTGFGARRIYPRRNIDDVNSLIDRTDFIVLDAQLPEGASFSFLHWLRHEANGDVRHLPVVMTSSEASETIVHRARDAGAHFIIAKPLKPGVLLQRICWIAREGRMFIECDTYAGPDRRFQRLGPPIGVKGRRSEDKLTKLGQASEPNLSQDEINAMLKPSKVKL